MAHQNPERRDLLRTDAGLELRQAGDAEQFAGYAAVFNSRTAIGDPTAWGFYEQIAPGAFSRTLAQSDIRMLIDHDPYYVVSRMSAGTLSLSEDSHGLAVSSALDPSVSYVNDLRSNLRNGNVSGMSFGFMVRDDSWETETRSDDGMQVEVRTIRDVDLIEVSAVTFPAYTDTAAGMRSVSSALVNRGDVAAIERRAEFAPEFGELLKDFRSASEPVTDESAEPEVRLSLLFVDMQMRAWLARNPELARIEREND